MILVTGGAGYIGSHVLLELAKSDEKVIVVDNLSTGHSDSLLHNEKLLVGDLSDESFLEHVFKKYRPDSIIHFAASINAPESVNKPLMYYQNNFRNTLNVLKYAQQYQVKHFIFSSTAAVYGSVGDTPVKEDHLLSPLNPYGWSKRMSEQVIQDVAAISDLKFVILRYFNVAGADPQARVGQRTKGIKHLLRACLDVATGETDSISVFGQDFPTPDGTGVRDYIHVSDLAQAHISALKYLQDGNESQIFNVGYGTGYSVLEVVKAVEKIKCLT